MLKLDQVLLKRHGNGFTFSGSKMESKTGFLFSKLSEWCFKIKQASAHGKWREVLSGYSEVHRAGIQFNDPFIFPIILKACAKLSWLFQGRLIHASLIKKGLDSSASIGNSVVDFYMKCGDFCSAMDEFECMGCRDSICWNIIVFGLLDRGFAEEGLWWFWKSRASGFEPNISTLVLAIHACRSLHAYLEREKLHGYLIRSGLLAVPSVQNSILRAYAENDTAIARKLFDEMSDKDVISWSVTIRSYVQSQEALLGLQLFQEMVHEAEIEPDGTTVTIVLKACAVLGDIDTGRLVHGFIIRKGFDLVDVFVANSLIDMYSKCHDADSAFRVFNEMTRRNIVSWNSIVSAFVHSERYHEAFVLFHSMGKEVIDADAVTLVSLLQICKFLGQPLPCKSIHCVIIRHEYETNELLLSSLVDAYANCSLVDHARTVFAAVKKKDVVSWSAMISGLARSGRPNEAISIFREMTVNPNAITIINLLDACSVSAGLRKSKWAHGIAIRRGVATTDVSVGTAIVDTYAKCGAIDAARRAFDQILIKNVISWTAIVSAYAMNGRPQEALTSFEEMKRQSVPPNPITYLAALSACSHGGLIQQGLKILQSMVQDHNGRQMKPSLQHYSCIIDMLSRAGEIETAMELIKNLPEEIKARGSAWGAVLSGCRSHGKNEISSEAVAEILELEPLCSSSYSLASSVFAAKKSWDDVAMMRRLTKERRVKVVAGYSLVHVGNMAQRFLAGEKVSQCGCDLNGVVLRLHGCLQIEEIEDEDECHRASVL